MRNHLERPNQIAVDATARRRRHLARHHRLVVGMSREREHRRSRRMVIWSLAGVLCLPIAGAVLVMFALGGAAASTAAARARVLPADSLVFDRTGGLIADVHPAGATRLPVPLTAISPLLQQAIVAVEDRSFWTEGAVDVPRMAAAAISDLTHGTSQGASTVPMQLAKILYLNNSRTFSYKVQQIALAERLSSSNSRAVILDDYLNDIYFGSGATGIQAAAHTYFGIDASRLDLAQAAMLAGIPNNPTGDDPLINPAGAVARQELVLDAMYDTGAITLQVEQAALHERLAYTSTNPDNVNVLPFFTARVVKSVQTTWHLNALTAGLRILSTLDLGLQQFTQHAVSTQIAQLGRLHVTDGAAVVISPASGDVLAYVGSAGANVPGGQIDMAAAPRQPGSSFKIFTYTTAIQDARVSMVTPVLDGPLTLPTGGGPNGTQPYSPLDYTRTWHGVPARRGGARQLAQHPRHPCGDGDRHPGHRGHGASDGCHHARHVATVVQPEHDPRHLPDPAAGDGAGGDGAGGLRSPPSSSFHHCRQPQRARAAPCDPGNKEGRRSSRGVHHEHDPEQRREPRP